MRGKIHVPWYNSREWRRAAATWLTVVWLGLIGCASIPKDYPRSESNAFEPSTEGELARLGQEIEAEFGNNISGFLLLDRNVEALKWRLLLADLALHSLDVQYFIWQGDESSVLLADRILRAADRGVRIRMLIDDVLLQGGDKDIAALNQHPQIEVRMFNPWEGRSGSGLFRNFEFIFHIKRLNHRMHNKLVAADNRVAIVGGRNIGNAYFGLSKKYNFTDVDVVAAGPITKGLSRSFDNYWNSKWAYSGKALADKYVDKDLLSELRQQLKQELSSAREYLQSFPSEPETWDGQLHQFRENMRIGTATVVYDEPWLGADIPPVQLVESLEGLGKDAREEILIVSPYFIPDKDFYESLDKIVARGVRVKILTNSLGSTNHAIVNSAYQRHRKPVIRGGAELYELRDDAAVKPVYDTPPVEAKFLGLHSKVIVVDRHLVLVGSLNLDPRSIYINTEMGLLIDSPGLGEEIATIIDRDLEPENSWRVLLDGRDQLVWISSDATVRREPARNFGQRFQSCCFGMLPLQGQL
jgi:putative cardiolipin synthase